MCKYRKKITLGIWRLYTNQGISLYYINAKSIFLIDIKYGVYWKDIGYVKKLRNFRILGRIIRY